MAHYAASVPAPPDDVAVSVDGVSKAFRLPHEQVHTLKERVVHPLRRRSFDRAAGAARRVAHRRQGRVLRDRRAQRQRQEHAAEVPGRHLQRRRGRDVAARAHVAVHRAGRRLQPRPHRPRQRAPQRDHARPLARAGRRALRRDHRLRRAARVPGPQAEELLVGDAGAPGVRGHGPGRRGRAAHRRGARGRRRLLPAEVLRRPAPGQARRPHDPARHARHGPGPALLRPRDAAGARRRWSRSAARARSHAATRS